MEVVLVSSEPQGEVVENLLSLPILLSLPTILNKTASLQVKPDILELQCITMEFQWHSSLL